MKLKISNKRHYSWPVTVSYPEDGSWVDVECTAEFRAPDTNVIQALGSFDAQPIDVLREHLVGWSGISFDFETEFSGATYAPDAPIPFSRDAMELVLQDACVAKGMVDAFIASLKGGEAKN